MMSNTFLASAIRISQRLRGWLLLIWSNWEIIHVANILVPCFSLKQQIFATDNFTSENAKANSNATENTNFIPDFAHKIQHCYHNQFFVTKDMGKKYFHRNCLQRINLSWLVTTLTGAKTKHLNCRQFDAVCFSRNIMVPLILAQKSRKRLGSCAVILPLCQCMNQIRHGKYSTFESVSRHFCGIMLQDQSDPRQKCGQQIQTSNFCRIWIKFDTAEMRRMVPSLSTIRAVYVSFLYICTQEVCCEYCKVLKKRFCNVPAGNNYIILTRRLRKVVCFCH